MKKLLIILLLASCDNNYKEKLKQESAEEQRQMDSINRRTKELNERIEHDSKKKILEIERKAAEKK